MKNILSDLLANHNLSIITDEVRQQMSSETFRLLNKVNWDNIDIENVANPILLISNLLYENTDISMLPLDDDMYDLLLEKYRFYNPNVPVGAKPIDFGESTLIIPTVSNTFNMVSAVEFIDTSEMLYFDNLIKSPPNHISPYTLKSAVTFDKSNELLTRRTLGKGHSYPELVGTLTKCKFVLCSQAIEKGVFGDLKVKVFERDFFQKHIEMGVLDPNRRIRMVLELKWDGISVEAEVTSRILDAGTRGDAINDLAADITPVLEHYIFPNALGVINDFESFGMKFESILTYANLKRYCEARGKEYVNPRAAMTGLYTSADAAKFTEYITLIPLATSLGIDRLTELEFMDRYYTKDEHLRYVVIEGTYKELLFQIKRFVEEAEYMRASMPFMYDGIVVSYIDQDIIDALGRKNAVNLYSTAIKFNPMKKQTIFRGWKYTVGQDGSITPMIYFDAISFLGGIHDHSSGHSYGRFLSLELRFGDILDADFVNDVMLYITKPDNSHNAQNQNPVIEFIKECPECGSIIRFTDKSAFCDNKDCRGRILARVVNMLDKLNLKDFSTESLAKISKFTLTELMDITYEELIASEIGEVNSLKFLDRMSQLKTEPISDYSIMGALGFNNIADKTWEKILRVYSLNELLSLKISGELFGYLINIKDIGSSKAETICDELDYFAKDIETILRMPNVIISKGSSAPTGGKIRFSGFRNSDWVNRLRTMGFDADDNASVTKDTILLIVNSVDDASKKISDAEKYGIPIIHRDSLWEYMEGLL